MLFGPIDEGVFQGHEIGGAAAVGIGPVERLHQGAVAVLGRAPGRGAPVHVVAAPSVPALPGEHAVLDHIGGVAGRAPDGQGDIALGARVGDELEQVVPLDEPLPDDEAHGRGPVVAGHHVGGRRQRARRLNVPFQLARPPDEAAALAPVITGAVGAYVVPGRLRRHIKGDFLALPGGRQVGEPVYRGPGPARQVPGRGPRLAVLIDHPAGLDPIGTDKGGRARRDRGGGDLRSAPPMSGLGGDRRPSRPCPSTTRPSNVHRSNARLTAGTRTGGDHHRRHQHGGQSTGRCSLHVSLECT